MIDWNFVKKITILGNELSDPYDISLILKKNSVRKYIYRITYEGILIKFGMSADNSRNFGERLYRQLGHCKSWADKRLCGSSGSDWRVIEEDFKNRYGYEIDHNKITITVFDLTDYPFTTISTWDEIVGMETFLIDQYEALVGEKPIGNLHDNENVIRRPKILISTWEKMFE